MLYALYCGVIPYHISVGRRCIYFRSWQVVMNIDLKTDRKFYIVTKGYQLGA